MKKVVLGLIGATALVGSTMAVAGSADNATAPLYGAKTGVYLNGNLGYGGYDYAGNTGSDHGAGLAWAASAGYQFTKNLAVEVGYVGLPSNTIADITVHQGYVNVLAKALYSIKQYDVFAKAGLGLTTESAKGSGVTVTNNNHYPIPVVGAGVDYNFTDHVAATLEGRYSFKTDNVSDTLVGLAGISYKF